MKCSYAHIVTGQVPHFSIFILSADHLKPQMCSVSVLFGGVKKLTNWGIFFSDDVTQKFLGIVPLAFKGVLLKKA